MRVFAIHFDFLEKLALEIVFFHKLGNLLVTRWLLLAKLRHDWQITTDV